MFKFVVVLVLSVACASATPGVVAAQYVAPLDSAIVTSHSSQVVARNYNALAAPFLSAPLVAAPAVVKAAPLVNAAPYFASPYVAAPVAAPLVKAAPFVAAPFAAPRVKAAPLVASPYAAAPVVKAAPVVAAPALPHYASPFAHYHAAPAYYF